MVKIGVSSTHSRQHMAVATIVTKKYWLRFPLLDVEVDVIVLSKRIGNRLCSIERKILMGYAYLKQILHILLYTKLTYEMQYI